MQNSQVSLIPKGCQVCFLTAPIKIIRSHKRSQEVIRSHKRSQEITRNHKKSGEVLQVEGEFQVGRDFHGSHIGAVGDGVENLLGKSFEAFRQGKVFGAGHAVERCGDGEVDVGHKLFEGLLLVKVMAYCGIAVHEADFMVDVG